MSTFDGNGTDAWAVLHQNLLEFLNVSGEQPGVVVQPLAVSTRAEWDTGNTRLNVFYQQQLANAVPTWTPLYERAGGGAKNVPDEYLAFLDRLSSAIIKQTPSIDQAKLRDLIEDRTELINALKAFNEDTRRQYTAYVVSSAPPRMNRNEWERRYGFSGQRQVMTSQLDMINGEYQREVATAGGELLEIGRAISELGMENQRISLPANEMELELGEDSWNSYYKSYIAGNLQQFKGEEQERIFRIDSSAQRSTSFEKRWGVSAGASWFGLWRANGSVENQDINKQWENSTQSVEIRFGGINRFDIVRGPWLKSGLLDQFRDRLPPEFWGAGGRLNLMPTSVILAHGLRVTVKGSSEVGSYLKEYRHRAGGGGFRVGPFGFGGKASYTTSMEQTNVDVKSDGFTISDNSGRAIILAVVSTRPLDLYVAPTPAPQAIATDGIARLSGLRADGLAGSRRAAAFDFTLKAGPTRPTSPTNTPESVKALVGI